MPRPQARPVVHIDDDRFKVTEWCFEKDAETGWHVHGHDYVVVPLSDGRLDIDLPGGGTQQAPLRRHVPYSRRTGVHHNVVNGSGAYLSFLEVEVVDDVLAHAREALLDRFAAAWNAHDLDGLMDCMAEDCAFHASAGAEAEGKRHVGRAAVRAAYAAIYAAFPDARWNGGRHRVTGDFGVSQWRFTGTDRSGRRVEADGCDLFRFAGAKIALKDSYRKNRSA